MFPLQFRAEANHEETWVMGLSSSEEPNSSMKIHGILYTRN